MTDTPIERRMPGAKVIAEWKRSVRTATHDNMFLALLSVPVILEEILRECLRPDLVAKMAARPPEIMPGDFLNRRMKRSRCDLVCKVHLTSKRTPYIFVIFEHKSRPERNTVRQLMTYEIGVREMDAVGDGANELSLVPVFRIVLYNGKRPWNAPRTFEQLVNLDNDPVAAQPTLDETHHLIDTHRTRIPNLCRYPRGRAALALLKRPEFSDLIPELGNIPDVGNLHRQILAYIARWYKMISVEQWESLASALAPLQKEWDKKMYTIGDAYQERGVALGLAKGRTEGRIEGLAEGEAKGRAKLASLLVRLLKQRFGAVPRRVRTRISKASHEQLEGWSAAVIDAKSLDDVFGGVGDSGSLRCSNP